MTTEPRLPNGTVNVPARQAPPLAPRTTPPEPTSLDSIRPTTLADIPRTTLDSIKPTQLPGTPKEDDVNGRTTVALIFLFVTPVMYVAFRALSIEGTWGERLAFAISFLPGF